MPQKSGFSTTGVQRSYLSAAGGLLTGRQWVGLRRGRPDRVRSSAWDLRLLVGRQRHGILSPAANSSTR
jgi:hypothetical protein